MLSLLAHTTGSASGQPSLMVPALVGHKAAPHAAPLPHREGPPGDFRGTVPHCMPAGRKLCYSEYGCRARFA